MQYSHRAKNGVSTPLRVAYLLLTAGRPLTGREIADEIGIKSASNIIHMVDDMELAGFVTEVNKIPSKGKNKFKYIYSARLE